MIAMPLGKLTRIALREVWKHEANDFTVWLSQEDNLRLLGDEIGYEISLIGTETAVGNFNCDILCEEESTKKKIIIENQLETTDHDHLGKLITYASGHSASVAIWVVSNVREEHRKAIDWLNDHTDEDVEFYLIKMELWQIADSPYAPKFEIICKPNDWARSVKEASTQSELSETKLDQLEFWTEFKAFVVERGSSIRPQRPSPKHWTFISIGSSDASISLTINGGKELFACELYIPDNKMLYKKLLTSRSLIEVELEARPEWMELPGKKASRIKLSIPGTFRDKSSWEQSFDWLLAEAERFARVFPKYIRALVPENASSTND